MSGLLRDTNVLYSVLVDHKGISSRAALARPPTSLVVSIVRRVVEHQVRKPTSKFQSPVAR